MSVILGINAFHAGASASVLVDGRVVAAVAEERLNRVKYYAGFPKLSILKCLEIAGLTFKDIDYLAVGREPSANRSKKIEYVVRNPSRLLNLIEIKASRGQLDSVKDLLVSECGARIEDLRLEQFNVEHHLAHTASAYFISDWDKAAGFTVDGSGDFVTCMMSHCRGDEISVKRRIYVPHSLGSLYTMVCQFIGYTKYGDEGKVMGLAPLGQDTYREHFDDMVRLTDDGIELNPKYFLPFGSHQGVSISDSGEMIILRHYSDHMVRLFGAPREPYAELTQRDMDMAFGLQRVFEKTYMHLLNLLHRMVPLDRVAMAGGCALNSVANGKLFQDTPFQKTCIQPASGDDGLAVGAALYVSNAILREGKRHVMRDAFLGPEFSPAEIKAQLEANRIPHTEHGRESLLSETVGEIVAGNVVGWFQGRMEWGPRALGNRSILVHPGLPGIKDVLNARIKHRESFRPFAPAIVKERQVEIFEHPHPSPFMLHVYKIRPEWRSRLAAVNHVDDTGRLQTVAREENPLYYDLIWRFGKETGVPVLLNTSFNENEPIVCSPAEAINCYLRTKMDTLVIGPYICRKNAESV